MFRDVGVVEEFEAAVVPAAAEQSRPASLAARFLPSFTDAAFLVPILFIYAGLAGAHALLGDGDTGWHIRTGQWMMANGRVPASDPFSFTKPGEPWFAWEWLWDLAFGWMHAQWGMAAVVLASTVVIGLTFAALYRLALRKSQNAPAALVVTLVAAAVASIHCLARPHLLTMLFAVIFYALLERIQAGQTRLLYWLPPLMVLWTNLHGGFLAGLLFIAAYAAGEAVAWAASTARDDRAASLARLRGYTLAGAACLAATIVNPYGIKLHQHIYAYLTDPYQYEHIHEFFSLNFQHPMGKFVEAMIVLGAIAAARQLYRRQFAYPILFAGWAHLALLSARNIPIYAIAAAPAIAACLVEAAHMLSGADVPDRLRKMGRRVTELGREIGQIESIPRVPVATVAGVVLLGVLLHAQPNEKFRPDYDPKKYPARAIETLRGPEFAEGVFTDDEWGDYLIYRLYPRTKVFVDGRSDFYGSKFSLKYLDVMAVKWDWQKTLDRYRIHTVLLAVNSPLAGAMKETARWRPVYDDGQAIVFRRAAR
ncbi:MAG: hypothetical protein ACM336_09255 [Acidobacteriota bacterium]